MNSVLDLIPQRPPIVMVDDFLGIDNCLSRTSLLVAEDNLFVDDCMLSECGLIEHIAQSAAARVGYLFKEKEQPIPIGYIGSVNDFIMVENPKVGELIITTVEVIQEVFNITLIQARCTIDEREIASCKMKIFLDQ